MHSTHLEKLWMDFNEILFADRYCIMLRKPVSLVKLVEIYILWIPPNFSFFNLITGYRYDTTHILLYFIIIIIIFFFFLSTRNS